MISAAGPPRRLFLDANVLFTAAHNPEGKAALMCELGARGAWTLITSAYAVAEARHNLGLKYPQALERFDDLLDAVRVVGDTLSPPQDSDAGEWLARQRQGLMHLPAKDVPILVAALRCRATHLLTGDVRHFGVYMDRPDILTDIVVQTVADFLATG